MSNILIINGLAEDFRAAGSFNPYNAEATFIQSTRMQTFLITILTLSCWYSLESSRRVLLYEYPFARVSVIFSFFASFCVGQIIATTSIRVKEK